MTDDTIVPSPMLDRQRVAEAIQRRVRLDVHPIHAKAAVHGQPIELTDQQALAVADTALAALVDAHPINGRQWLIKANQDWQTRNHSDQLRYRALLAGQRAVTDRWRSTAMNGYVWLLGAACVWQWHWSRWVLVGIGCLGLCAAGVLRWWLMRRDKRKADAR